MTPTTEQIGYLLSNIADLEIIGDFTVNEPVAITPSPDDIREIAEKVVVKNQCYQNVSEIIALTKRDVKFVTGVITGGLLPICHAWLKIGDEYHDPTFEVMSQRVNCTPPEYIYHPTAELDLADLIIVTLANKFRPPHPAAVADMFPELLLINKVA